MRSKFKALLYLLGASLVLGLPWALLSPGEPSPAGGPIANGGANPSALKASFRAWWSDHDARGGDRNVVYSLGWSKGYSREYSTARGIAQLDLLEGSVQVELQGLRSGEEWDVWLVENRPGGGALADRGDRMQRLGRVTAGPGATRLSSRLGAGFFNRFQADLIVVCRAGKKPEEAGVLFGSPDFFQRLYTQRRMKPSPMPSHQATGLASLFGPRVASATAFDSLDALVAQGADLFQNEKFNGNGRTCGTCHPPRNNFTIDPKFIATLPPNDALFVFESNPDLGQNFENSQLLREMGLVTENADGFDDLAHKFVLRGVPHTLALLNSRLPQPNSSFEPMPPVERLGWGGDGAPGSGSLREFALGAIIQHATRTLNRTPGVDFRVPTDQELDAMAAFQLALGRQEEVDLPNMIFKSPIVRRGQTVYLTGDSAGGTLAAGKCNRCHFNGGSNVSVGNQNRNFDVGIEQLPNHPANLILPGAMPIDGGFGTAAKTGGGFGNGRFNPTVVVEAADTGPFFHNNAVSTIEEAVDFYNSAAFNNSPAALGFKSQDTGGIGIHLETTDVESVAALLRVLNALENIRSSSEFDRAVAGKSMDQARMLSELALADTGDAIRVLEERNLHFTAIAKLKEAYALERLIPTTAKAQKRNALIPRILSLKEQARAEMIETQ
jgi:hypothetical protein